MQSGDDRPGPRVEVEGGGLCGGGAGQHARPREVEVEVGSRILSADNDERSRGDANAMCVNQRYRGIALSTTAAECLVRQAPNRYTSVDITDAGLGFERDWSPSNR